MENGTNGKRNEWKMEQDENGTDGKLNGWKLKFMKNEMEENETVASK